MEAFLVEEEIGMEVADVDTHDGVAHGTLAEATEDGVGLGEVDGELHVGIGIDMLSIEEAALGLAGILARVVVVVGEMDAVDVGQHFAFALAAQGDVGDGGAMADLPAFLVGAVPVGGDAFDVDTELVVLALLEGKGAEGEAVLVELHVDVLGGEARHGEGNLLLLLFQLLADGLLVGVVVALEGVEDELVVRHGVDGVVADVVDLGMDALEACLFDAYDAVDDERHEVGLDLEEVGTEHGSLLAVLDVESVELGIECDEVDTDAVNIDARLQLVLQHGLGTTDELVLDGVGIDEAESCNEQDDYQYDDRNDGAE